MQVRLLVDIGAVDNHRDVRAGQVIEVSEKHGNHLVSNRYAVAVVDVAPETASLPPGETATVRRPRKRPTPKKDS